MAHPCSGRSACGCVAFNDGDLHSGFGKLARTGASCDARADDHDVKRGGQN
jgi:hypothetical protein